jgi:hypothetical protein
MGFDGRLLNLPANIRVMEDLHVFRRVVGDNRFVRGYHFPPSEPGRVLVIEKGYKGNLSEYAVIFSSPVSERLERRIREGRGHLLFGEPLDSGYLGVSPFPGELLGRLYGSRARGPEGWEAVSALINRAVAIDNVAAMRPGEEAEGIIDSLLAHYPGMPEPSLPRHP